MTERETALERAGERARETRVNTAREGGSEGHGSSRALRDNSRPNTEDFSRNEGTKQLVRYTQDLRLFIFKTREQTLYGVTDRVKSGTRGTHQTPGFFAGDALSARSLLPACSWGLQFRPDFTRT